MERECRMPHMYRLTDIYVFFVQIYDRSLLQAAVFSSSPNQFIGHSSIDPERVDRVLLCPLL